MKKSRNPWFVSVGTLLLAWLGLSGISDSFLEWRGWFEYGIMAHWRTFKWMLHDHLLFWVPFNLPNWIIDYLILGSIVTRSFIHSQTEIVRDYIYFGRKRNDFWITNEDIATTAFWRGAYEKILMIFTWFIYVTFWPFVLFRNAFDLISPSIDTPPPAFVDLNVSIRELYQNDERLYNYMMSQKREAKIDNTAMLKNFAFSVISFVPVLFIITNELTQISSYFLPLP